MPAQITKLTTVELLVLRILCSAALSIAGDVAGWGMVILSQAHKILTQFYRERLVQRAQLGMTLPV